MIKAVLDTYSDSYLFIDAKNPQNNLRYCDFANKILEEIEYLKKLKNDFYLYPLNNDPQKYFISLLACLFSEKTLLPSLAPYPELQNFKLYPILEKTENVFKQNLDIIKGDHPFLALSTSGSSGERKIFAFSLKNILSSAHASIRFYQMKARDRHLLHLPLHHIGGNMVFWRAFLSGGSIFTNDPNIEGDYDYLSLVPLQLRRLLEMPKLKYYKAILLGGEKCPQDLIDLIKENKIPVSLTYGLTESCAQVTATLPGHVEFECVGQALMGRDITIKNGRIQIESEANAEYIIHNGELLRLPSSEILTEDQGEFKADQLFVYGRLDQIFISGGENISPQELEHILSAKFSFNFKKVLPVPDLKFGQVPAFFYQGDTPQEEIYYQAKSIFSAYKVPKYFIKLDGLNAHEIKHSKNELLKRWQLNFEQKELQLFIHGFLGDSSDFSFLSSNHGLCLLLPGHGHYKDFNYKNLDDYLEAVIKAYHLNSYEKVQLCGYSQGGRIALGLASKLKNIAKLTLIAAHPGLKSEEDKRKRLNQDQKLFAGKDLSAFLDFWYAQEIFSLNSNQQKVVKEKRKNNNLLSLTKSLELFSLGLQPSYWDFLKNYTGELHYIYGELDQKYKNIAEDLKALNSRCQIHVITGAGHNPLLFHQVDLLKIKI
jgi:o-succinylbenzoate---CoA ligase